MSKDNYIESCVKYYQEKIIDTIKNCNDIKVLHYLDKFNRLYIEKYCKKEE